MPLDIAAKILECKHYSQVKPILEMLGASKSSHELMQLYFAQPENSVYRTRFLDTVVQEMEDGIDTKKLPPGEHDKGKIEEMHNDKNAHEMGHEMGTKEYEITGQLSSIGSSGEQPAPEGTQKGPGVGDSHASPTENQMKEMPPGMPGMPGMQTPGMPPGMQQMGMPGMPPEMAQQMEQAMTKLPAMNPMQQMRYIQEMVKGMVTPLYSNLNGIKEALTKLDSKIQEIQIKSVPLSIPGGNDLVMPTGPIREIGSGIDNGPGYISGAQPPPPRKDVAAKRQLIVEKDRIINATKQNKDVSQMYQ